jgi:hypothetical protein
MNIPFKEINMNKKIITTILAALAVFAHAESTATQFLSDLSKDRQELPDLATRPSAGFTYFRFAAADSTPTSSVQIVPGLGAGYRMTVGDGAFDFSASYSSAKGWKEGTGDSYFWTLPRISYVHYLNPIGGQSLYAGLGLAWGGLETKNGANFEGVISSATLGFELRGALFRTFTELNVSQPTIARAVFPSFPGPIAEISIGAGF